MSSRWNEADHRRDDHGRFTDGAGGGSSSSAPARSGGSRRKRLPETISSASIKAKGGDVKLDHYGDGSLGITTPGGAAKLSPGDRERLSDAFSGAEEMDPGESKKVGAATLTREKSGYTLRVGDDSEGIPVTKANLEKMNDKSQDMSDYSKRVETGWGEADLSIAPGNKLGLRILGDDGNPVDIEIPRAQALKLRSAISATFEGDDPDGEIDLPESGVLDKIDVPLGKGRSIHVEQQGHDNPDAKGNPQGNLMIEADDGSWGITVTPENYDAFTDALWDVVDAIW